MSFAAEPAHSHGAPERTAVLLVKLGTPDAPTASAVRRYLAEFLSDRRVVEIPAALWWPILHGIVLRVRPAKSASKYASIWTPDGSPLLHWTHRQARMLMGYLGERGHPVLVRHAMRYGQPSIASALDALRAEGATRILVLPMYPQYAAATTASTVDAVSDWTRCARRVPEIRYVMQYHDEPAYIDALAASVQAQSEDDRWQITTESGEYIWDIHLVRLAGDSVVFRQADTLGSVSVQAVKELRLIRKSEVRLGDGPAGAMSALTGSDDEVYDLTTLDYPGRLRTVQQIFLLHPVK